METTIKSTQQLTPQQQALLDKVIKYLKIAVAFPVWFLPKKYQGYRRTIITWMIGVLVALQALDIAKTTKAFCVVIEAFVHLWNTAFICTPEIVTGVIVAWIAALYEALKEENKPSLFTNIKTIFGGAIKVFNKPEEVNKAA